VTIQVTLGRLSEKAEKFRNKEQHAAGIAKFFEQC
jgi:hypothetical protein